MKARTVYTHPDINPIKLSKLNLLSVEYQHYVQICIDLMVKNKLPKLLPSERNRYFPESGVLSANIKKCGQMHAVQIIESWVAGLYATKLKKLINKWGLTDQQRFELRTIGKYSVIKSGKFGKGQISQEMIDLYWSWVWNSEISGNTPKVSSNLPVWMTELVCIFGKSKKSTKFEWWINISCLDKGERVKIPLAYNPYIDDLSKLAKTVMMQKRNGRWSFQFTEKTEEPKFDGSKGRIGIDIGLNVIAATSDGRIYGRSFKPKFDRLYSKVQSIRANRQRQGLKENSKRLDRLETRLSGMTKTVTGTIANRLVQSFPDHTFIIEDLDLRGCRGQKRFAYRALQKSLTTKAAVIKVNPAYTSQTCPSCSYISRQNRNGVKFHCRSCGRKGHADVIGAMNLARRSGDKQIHLNDHPSVVKEQLRTRFRQRRASVSTTSHNAPESTGRKLTVEGSSKEDIYIASNSR